MNTIHNWKEWIGTDESGKGDYFGPLVVAGVYVNSVCKEEFEEQGIVDGKKISINQIRKMTDWLREHYNENIVVIKKMPTEYNSVYKQLQEQDKNLNHLLAEMHIKAIKKLSTQTGTKNAVIDKFSYSDIITPKFNINDFQLKQVTKGERDIAVAAASVIARDTFRDELSSLSDDYKLDLPPGATHVIQTGKDFIRTHGKENLKHVAKLHFKTTKQVLNQKDS
ncbi:ribonuclease HIII [Candidatus Poribacteria bacterium]|nr:ribonuclease HIII [Candidatus Poribacteria bacterium]